MNGFELFGTPEEQLLVVNQAIYTILGLLCDMQSKLQAAVANDQESPLFGDTVVAVFDGR